MQKIQVIISEVLLCNILNVWFPKPFYSYFLWLRNEKVRTFQIFPTLVQEKCWPQLFYFYRQETYFFNETFFFRKLRVVEQLFIIFTKKKTYSLNETDVAMVKLLPAFNPRWCYEKRRSWTDWNNVVCLMRN